MQGQALRAAAAVAVVMSAGCAPAASDSAADTVDRTAQLQARLDGLQPGGTLELEADKTYLHSGILTVRVPNVTIDGNGATLRATNDETSAFEVDADGVTVTDLTLAAPAEGVRWFGEDQHKLVVRGDNSTVSRVTVDGSAGAGIYLTGVQNFSVRDIAVIRSRADGLHVTGGSAYGHVDTVKTEQTGDDGVAVVSYDHDDEGTCHDIVVRNVDVAGTTWGRGITVVGGTDIQISGFSVADTSSAGIYVANEGDPFFTRSVQQVLMSNGTISGANWDAGIEQGSILVYAGNRGRFVRDVTIPNVEVTATSPTAGRDVAIVDETKGGLKAMSEISLNGIHLRDSDVAPFYTNVPAAAFSTADWTLQGEPISVEPQ
jgi:hypothetical protein